MKYQDIFKYCLGALIVIGFFVLLIILVKDVVPTQNNDLLNLTIGALIGNFATVVQYYFGSSVSNTTKDKTISDALNKPIEKLETNEQSQINS
jgi:hypothetical protein